MRQLLEMAGLGQTGEVEWLNAVRGRPGEEVLTRNADSFITPTTLRSLVGAMRTSTIC